MSRSQPHAHDPNPATRWYEWNGETGQMRYYDKAQEHNIDVPLPFTFLLLDELATIGGWNEPSGSSIYANEVRDTRTDPFIVKSFKGGLIDTGLYKDIKEHVTSRAVGGQFVAVLYLGYKDTTGALALGAFKVKGAALGAWMEFRKAHRGALYTSAVQVTGYDEGKKGRIIYRTPTFSTVTISPKSDDAEAKALDQTLQAYLTAYFARTTEGRTAAPPAAGPPEPPPPSDDDRPQEIDADDIPF
jgi:hypothetical protein